MVEEWRKKPVSPAQSNFLENLGYKGKTPKNMGEASDLINKYTMIRNANALRDKVNYELTENVISNTDEVIGLYSYVLTKCVEADIYEPPLIGMLFKSVDERTKQTIK